MGKPIYYGTDENFFYHQDNYRIHFLDTDHPFYILSSAERSLELYENGRTQDRSEALEQLADYVKVIGDDRSLWTLRQWEILQLLFMGKTQQEMAIILGIGQASVCKTLHGNQIGNEKQGGIIAKFAGHLRDYASRDEALMDALSRGDIKLPPERIRRLLCDADRAVYIETHGKAKAFYDHYKACRKLRIKPSHPTSIKIISRLEIGHTVICGTHRVSRFEDMRGEISDVDVQLSRGKLTCTFDGEVYSSLADAIRAAYPDGGVALRSRVRNQIQKKGYHEMTDGRIIKKGE